VWNDTQNSVRIFGDDFDQFIRFKREAGVMKKLNNGKRQSLLK